MGLLERLSELFTRLQAYPGWQVLLELAVIWVVVYMVVRFIQGTRAAGVLKSLLFLIVTASLLIRIFNQRDAFQRLSFIYEHLLAVIAIAMVIIFQPELRRGLTRIGEANFFRRTPRPVTVTVDAVAEAATFLSKARFGGLIVLERDVPLKGVVEGGTPMDAQMSSRLLQTIFFPGTTLHDLAVLIKDNRIRAAGVQLPLAEEADMPDANLGSRHRAAVGVTQESDAVVVVVSEETGTISLAERGKLTRGLNEEELRGLLLLKLNKGLVRKISNLPVEEPLSPRTDAEPESDAGTPAAEGNGELAGGDVAPGEQGRRAGSGAVGA